MKTIKLNTLIILILFTLTVSCGGATRSADDDSTDATTSVSDTTCSDDFNCTAACVEVTGLDSTACGAACTDDGTQEYIDYIEGLCSLTGDVVETDEVAADETQDSSDTSSETTTEYSNRFLNGELSGENTITVGSAFYFSFAGVLEGEYWIYLFPEAAEFSCESIIEDYYTDLLSSYGGDLIVLAVNGTEADSYNEVLDYLDSDPSYYADAIFNDVYHTTPYIYLSEHEELIYGVDITASSSSSITFDFEVAMQSTDYESIAGTVAANDVTASYCGDLDE
jgi:hypothetical protein